MKIYTKIIFDKNNNLILEESFNYHGKVALAGIHYSYKNTRSAKLMEKQAKREKKLAERKAKREAKENAERRWLEEVSDGRYRSSKLVPVMWDLRGGKLLAPAGSDAVYSALRDLIQTTLGARLQPLSAGSLALDLLASRGMTSAFDDANPDAFVSPPVSRQADVTVGDRPSVPWAEGGPEPKDFLGNIFLMWL